MGRGLYVEDKDEEGGPQAGSKERARPDGTIHKHTRRHHCPVLLESLNRDKCDNENAKENEKGDDSTTAPWVFGAAPLQSKKQADDTGNKERIALQVEGPKLLREAEFLLHSFAWSFEEENDEQGGHRTERKVDIETPAPGEMVSEGATQAACQTVSPP